MLANLGVIAGIVFLAVEIRQNDEALREANRLSLLNARVVELQQYNEFRALLFQDPELLEIWELGLADELVDSSHVARFQYLCTNYVWMSATAFERSVELNRRATADGTVRLRGELLRDSPGFAACWARNRNSIVGYGLAEYVDAVEAVAGR